MSQQNTNIQPSITTSNQNPLSQNVQKVQQINTNSSSTPGIQSSKNIQILNSLNSNINLNQTSGLAFTLENNNIKPSSLKINQMTGSTLTLIPSINQINSNMAQNATSSQNNVSSSGSQTSTNSSSSSSSTSTYGGFAYCSNCGEYGVKAAFYGKSKLYCSVACQNGIKKQQQQQQQNHGLKRTVEALNQSPSHSQSVIQNTPAAAITSSNSNLIQNLTQSKSGHSSYSKSGQPTISSLLSQQSLLSKQNDNLQPESSSNLLSQSIVLSPITNNNANSPSINQNFSIMAPAKRARKTSNSSTLASSSNTDPNQPTVNNSMSITVPSQQSSFQNNTNDVKLQTTTPDESSKTNLESSFDWISYFEQHPDCTAAPVNAFKHAPLSNEWLKLIKNLKVEVPNRDQPPFHILERKPSRDQLYWFASVVKISGYWLKLRYIGFENDSSNDFWMHINDKDLHHIGWATDNQYFLTPPMKIIMQTDKWEDYAIKKILNSRTLSKNIDEKISCSLNSKFRKGMLLELVDKKALGQMRVAKIIENKGGRLRLKYENKNEFDDFWCHEKSDLIHPIGWSVSVGHKIISSPEYLIESAKKYQKNKYTSQECSPEMFFKEKNLKKIEIKAKFRKNMKLEAVDPLNLSCITVATITEILSDGYLMIEVDGCTNQNEKFCYHCTSSCLLPAGFCAKNKIPLEKPLNYKKKFDWETYLKETQSEYAPPELLITEKNIENPFRVGMKLESVDLMEPKLICVATVVAVVDRLVRLNFDGWDQKYDQWVDFESCDIYPIGWCHLVGYKLEELPKNNEEKRQKKRQSRKVSN